MDYAVLISTKKNVICGHHRLRWLNQSNNFNNNIAVMYILTYYENDSLKLGIKIQDKVIDVLGLSMALGLEGIPTTPDTFFEAGSQAFGLLKQITEQPADILAQHTKPEEGLKIGPSVPNPGKIICVGLNYRKHAIEAGMQIPTEPVLFSKYRNTIAAIDDIVYLPKVANEYDYEVELAFVIGQKTQNVSVENALASVMGYCNVNDVSARDLQLRTGQWLIGKNLDGFLPVGPYFISADEVKDPQDLAVKCWRNGALVQNSSTSDMIFSVAEIISHISHLMTLEPGDLITTGTPEGVIFGMDEKVWLKTGDEVKVAVEGFGTLTNTFERL